MCHDIAAAAESSDRHAAAYHLPQRCQVRLHSIVALCAGKPKAESGHYLVKNEDALIVIANLPERLQKSRLWRYAVHIPRYRFDDDAGNLLAPFPESSAHAFRIVEGERKGMISQISGHPRRAGHTQGQRAGACLHQQ